MFGIGIARLTEYQMRRFFILALGATALWGTSRPPSPQHVTRSAEIYYLPQFSLDGTHLLYTVKRSKAAKGQWTVIRVLNLRTQKHVDCKLPAEASFPGEWIAGTTKFIAYSHENEDDLNVWMCDAERGTSEQVLKNTRVVGPVKFTNDGKNCFLGIMEDEKPCISSTTCDMLSAASTEFRQQCCRQFRDFSVDRRARYLYVLTGNHKQFGNQNQTALMQVDLKTKERRDVCPLPNGMSFELCADGNWIAATVYPKFAINNKPNELYLISLRSGELTKIGDVRPGNSLQWNFTESKLAFECRGEITVLDVDADEKSVVSQRGSRLRRPFWNPVDGTLWAVQGKTTIVQLDGLTWVPRYELEDDFLKAVSD